MFGSVRSGVTTFGNVRNKYGKGTKTKTGEVMIDIILTDDNKKPVTSCGCALPVEQEKRIYLALRNALLDYPKLIEYFGE